MGFSGAIAVVVAAIVTNSVPKKNAGPIYMHWGHPLFWGGCGGTPARKKVKTGQETAGQGSEAEGLGQAKQEEVPFCSNI